MTNTGKNSPINLDMSRMFNETVFMQTDSIDLGSHAVRPEKIRLKRKVSDSSVNSLVTGVTMTSGSGYTG